jgi:hypothetical protein
MSHPVSQTLACVISLAAAAAAETDGIWRLTVGGVVPGSRSMLPMEVHLAVAGGAITQAICIAPSAHDLWARPEVVGLVVDDGGVRGTLAVAWPTQAAVAGAGPLPIGPAWTVQLAVTGMAGTVSGQHPTPADAKGKAKAKPIAGTVEVRRDPARVPGASTQVEWFAPDLLLADKDEGGLVIRAHLDHGRSVALAAVNARHAGGDALALTITGSATLVDGGWSIDAAVHSGGKTWQVQGAGSAVGDHLVGTVSTSGAAVRHASCQGRWRSDGWALPLGGPTGAWTVPSLVPADPALVAAAQADSLQPVLPGLPGQRAFWTWRHLAPKPGNMTEREVACIHPPSFDLRPVEGAVAYRYTITPDKAQAPIVFTQEQPWQPIVGGWSQLPIGPQCRLRVEALDAHGAVLPTAVTMGIIDKDSGEPTTIPVGTIALRRRPAFNGPYRAPASGWEQAALDAGRWAFEDDKSGLMKGTGCFGDPFRAGGEQAAAWAVAGQLWAALAVQALSTDAAEKTIAAGEVDRHRTHLAVCQDAASGIIPDGLFYLYKGYVTLGHLPAQALVDAWNDTQDPRFRAMAARCAAGIAAMQLPNGTWANADSKGGSAQVIAGVWPWKKARYFSASHFLYALGRMRTDCGIESARAAEAAALRHVRTVQVAEMYWPPIAHHSMTFGYPIFQHAESALYASRYLLECADPADRDLALAEHLARWAEDHDAVWRRSETTADQAAVFPRINAGDRFNNRSLNMSMLFAIVALELHQATGSALWLAKADAMAGAALASRDPVSGWIGQNMEARGHANDSHHADNFNQGHFAQLARDFARRRATVGVAP